MRHRHSFRDNISPLQRVALVLFALVQVIAPTWHVCEMSGRCADCPPGQTATVLSCHPPASQTAQAKRKCCIKKKHAAISQRPLPFDGTCLAKMLWAMPGSLVSPFDLQLLFSPLPVTAVSQPKYFQPVALPQPPARGPPLAFV
jgi:hypothetical protein